MLLRGVLCTTVLALIAARPGAQDPCSKYQTCHPKDGTLSRYLSGSSGNRSQCLSGSISFFPNSILHLNFIHVNSVNVLAAVAHNRLFLSSGASIDVSARGRPKARTNTCHDLPPPPIRHRPRPRLAPYLSLLEHVLQLELLQKKGTKFLSRTL